MLNKIKLFVVSCAFSNHFFNNYFYFFRVSKQKSGKIRLEAGKKYYIEAILIENSGSDHLSVAMDLPDGTRVGPITHEYLSKTAD